MEERKIIQVTRRESSWVDIHVILRVTQLASGQTLRPHSLYEPHLVQRISTSVELHGNHSVRPESMSTRMQSVRMSPRDWNCSFSATPRAPRNPPSEMATVVTTCDEYRAAPYFEVCMVYARVTPKRLGLPEHAGACCVPCA